MRIQRVVKGSIKPPSAECNSLAPKWKWINNSKIAVKFKESCLKQKKANFTHNNRVNLFIVYGLNTWSRYVNTDFTSGSCLFGAVKLTKNANPNICGCNGCGTEVDARSEFLLPSGEFGENARTFIGTY